MGVLRTAGWFAAGSAVGAAAAFLWVVREEEREEREREQQARQVLTAHLLHEGYGPPPGPLRSVP